MISTILLGLGNPMVWLVAMMAYILWTRLREWIDRKRGTSTHKIRAGFASVAMAGAAFQFFSVAYRPNHAFSAKAAIQQREDADDDEDGGPDTPTKHLHRQLRRIRRGEQIETFIWRLE